MEINVTEFDVALAAYKAEVQKVMDMVKSQAKTIAILREENLALIGKNACLEKKISVLEEALGAA